jgi:hypothetical protein
MSTVLGASTCTRWVEALWPRLQQDLRDPVRVEEHERDWRIDVMGALVVRLNRDHCSFRVAVRCQHAFLYGKCEDCTDFRIRSPLTSSHWLEHWVWRHADDTGLPATSLRAVVRPVALRLWQRLDIASLASARAKIAAALPLESDLLDLARRANPAPVLWLSHYCRVASGQEAPQTREREAATMIATHALFGSKYGKPFDVDFREIKWRAARLYALADRGWCALHQHGAAIWSPLRRVSGFGTHGPQMAAAWANLVATLPRKSLPPRRIALAWSVGFTKALRPADAVQEVRLIEAACRRWDRFPNRVERRHFVRNELLPVLAWARRLPLAFPVAPPQAGWNWYLRQVQYAHELALLARLEEGQPSLADDSQEFAGLRFARLTSLSAQLRAGLELHNCLAGAGSGYDPSTCPGEYFRIDDVATGRALACLRAQVNDAGRAVDALELRGPCNREVEPGLRRLVMLFLIQNRGSLRFKRWVERTCPDQRELR